ncbi:MAG TPA: C4-dicarboxylate ABC transporter [Janthinobacterium sp.]|nr:C4-dicarboxylate ABC transporter [Janthinobacterium sp.]
MTLLKRRALMGAIASSPFWLQDAWAQAQDLRISHQFPGGSIDEGDFRDRLSRTFAAAVEKRTRGSLRLSVHPNCSLMKSELQVGALRKGELDLALMPLSYAGQEVPEAQIGLLPGLVNSYQQAYAWKNAEIGRELQRAMFDKGIVIVSWIWLAGGAVSRGKPVLSPSDVNGMRMRGGSREMDLLLTAAGANIVEMPSNALYGALQGGTIDGAMISSSSLISFRLENVSSVLSIGTGRAFWYMFEPLMMSRVAFERLSKDQQAAIMAAGADMEAFARLFSELDDSVVGHVYKRAGVKVIDLTDTHIQKWQDLARSTCWEDFKGKSPACAKLLKLAQKVA